MNKKDGTVGVRMMVTENTHAYPKGYEPDFILPKLHGNYRFALGKQGRNPLVVLCMNPSAADETECDKTVEKIIKTARELQNDGWVIFNVYPERATDSDDLTDCDLELCKTNVSVIREYLLKEKIAEIWGAWGEVDSNRCLRQGKEQVLAMLKGIGVKVYCFKQNKSGNPHHPLYLNTEISRKIYL